MAEPNKVANGSLVKRREPTQDPVKIGARHAERLIAQFIKKAGLGDDAANALGHIAGQFAEGLTSHFADIFSKKGGIPTAELSKAYKQLGRMHDVDKFVAAPPENVTHENGLIDSRTFKISETGERGQYAAEGSIAKAGHAVGFVFDKLGLDLKGFDGNVAEVLDFAGGAKKNLADKDSWITIVGQMAMAAIGSPGSYQQRIGAALEAGVQGVKTAATKPSVDKMDVIDVTAKVVGTDNGTKTGLTNRAPTTSNTGSASGALAVRAQLLSGLKSQDDQVERTAGKVLGDVFRHLNVDPDKPTKRKLHATLRSLMADKSSATGKTDVVGLLDRVIGKLAERDPDNAVLAELNGFMQKAIAEDPDFEVNEGLHEAFGQVAADGISQLVAGELGLDLPEDSQLNDKLLSSLSELLPTPAETTVDGGKVDGAPEAEPVDLSAWNQDNPEIPQKFKDEAFKVIADSGLPQNHENTAGMVNAVASVMAASIDPESGGISPADFAVRLQAWLVDNGGASRGVFEGMYNQLGSAMSVHATTRQVFDQKKARYDELQAQQTTSTSRQATAPLEAELEDLHQELKQLAGNLEQGEGFLMQQIAMLQRDGLNRMGMMFFEGKAPGDGVAAQNHDAAAADGGGGGKVPPGGNGSVPPGGGEPPEGGKGSGRIFDREGPTGMGILPGFNAGMRPEDDYNSKNLTIQQQRAIKCGEVLADPSLTIEDKIFLFMMWFTAFTDQEREKKLEELVQMDRETARNQKLKNEKQTEMSSLEESLEKDESRLVQAQTKLQGIEDAGLQGPELDAAKADVDACQQHIIERKAKMSGVSRDLGDLEVKGEKAPKSREVLFMEIERLNQLRDKIMNMARSIMENSNRAIEKIFR